MSPPRSQSTPPMVRPSPYRRRISSGLGSDIPGVPARLPPIYHPQIHIDAYWRHDPEPEACRLYVAQAAALAEQKHLVTFDTVQGSYVPLRCGWLGLEKLYLAATKDILIEPAYCHHVINSTRPREWARLGVIKRHPMDPNVDIVGYQTPFTHVCIAHPIYPQRVRLLLRQPLVAQHTSHDEDSHLLVPSSYSALPYPDMRGTGSDQTAPLCETFNSALSLADADATFETDQFVYLHTDLQHITDSLTTESRYTAPGTKTIQDQQQRLWSKLPASSSLLQPSASAESRYTHTQAEARKHTDLVIVESILEAASKGQYVEQPMTHPAFSVEDFASAPTCFHQYLQAGVTNTVMQSTGYAGDMAIGTAIRQLNGLSGLSVIEFCELRKRSIKCLSCLCYFSFEGYQRHIRYVFRCQNTPAVEKAPDLTVVFESLPLLRIERSHIRPIESHRASLHNPVGLAWLMWNSPAGITHDTWVHLITAWRYCPGPCNRIRSFKAHLEHFAADDSECCAMIGDPEVGVFPSNVVDE
ncbi:hypothetical protein F5878DRAFT_723428 [Lentinula raphanica]|uniref:Uncharacterized protein n=1 Tax=Lentinula raphanica TaxID=153919 RepID=A0AA38PDD8_9AGAR|nr:hypothetical protein F5878DRAFT_723428 [Lentinula raphanica]